MRLVRKFLLKLYHYKNRLLLNRFIFKHHQNYSFLTCIAIENSKKAGYYFDVLVGLINQNYLLKIYFSKSKKLILKKK